MGISIIGGADGSTAIFLAGKLGNLFSIPAFLILILFYGIYFTKQIAQKRQGIQTRQLGRRRDKEIHTTEILLSAATALIVPVEVFSILADWSMMSAKVRIGGILLGLLGDLVFFTAILTMKNSWRAGIPDKDKTEFVTGGIYQYSRNPAFLGFDMMYIGILLLYFNWLLLAFTVWVMVMLHLQILQEEKYLQTVFGEEYLRYKECTCRYFGRKGSRP